MYTMDIMRLINLFIILVLKLHNIKRVRSAGCPVGYTVHPFYPNKCYHVSAPVSVTGDEYEDYCTSQAGGLRASIHNLAIYGFVNTLTNSNFMTGLLWKLYPTVFRWADGREYVYWPGVPTDTPKDTDVVAYVKTASDDWLYEDANRKLAAVCDITLDYGGNTLLSLVGGTAMCGRVEVFHDGLWGSIYDKSPDPSLGVFVCNYFGYDFVTFPSSCVSTPGTGKIWLESVSCPTNAVTIDDCIYNSSFWGTLETDHMSDVQVQCGVKTGPVTQTVTVTVTQTMTTSIYTGLIATSVMSTALSNITTPLNVPKYEKKTSPTYTTATVYDMRPSAVVIGSSAVLFFVGLFGFIIATDILQAISVHLSKQKKLQMKRRKLEMKRAKQETNLNDNVLYTDELTNTSSA